MARILTTHDVAKLVGADPSTVAAWVDDGRLKGWRTPRGHRRIDAAEVRRLLRHNGLKVSAAENMDTFAALGLVGIADRQTFKDALRATLVKRVPPNSKSPCVQSKAYPITPSKPLNSLVSARLEWEFSRSCRLA